MLIFLSHGHGQLAFYLRLANCKYNPPIPFFFFFGSLYVPFPLDNYTKIS